MIFVPKPEPSARARMLSGDFSRAIADARKRQPELSKEDVRQALEITREAEASGWAGRVLAKTSILGLMLLVGGLFLFYRQSTGGNMPSIGPMEMLPLLIGFVLVISLVLAKSR